jgi:DNA-directed RNA polymerase specialized sigma subunit
MTFASTPPAPGTPGSTSKYYLTNAQLLPEVIKSKEAGRMSETLASMLMMLTRRYASRPSFSGYTYKEDMIAEALADLCKNALKFNPERSNNPFAFYTSCINNSFLGFLNQEKKHRRIRDQLLVDIGENPSFSFQEEYREQLKSEGYVKEFEELSSEITEARERKIKEDLAAKAEAEQTAADRLLTFDDEVSDKQELSFDSTTINQEDSALHGHSLREEGEPEAA